jgi:hypothetical protein
MVSRGNRGIRRWVVRAVASVIAASVPWVVAPAGSGGITPAFAEEASAPTPAAAPAEHAAKEKPKAKKSRAHHDADATAAKAPVKKAQDKSAKESQKRSTHASTSKGKKTKKTASRAVTTKKRGVSAKKSGDKEAPRAPCFGPAVTVDRGGLETETFPLVDCAGAAVEDSRARLSILARPWGAARPPQGSPKPGAGTKPPATTPTTPPNEIAPGVRLLDKALISRIDKIARKFQGKTVSLVSGYRPQSRGSLHQSARAVDLRVTGVSNAELVAFCRTLADTGCGYYPNSSFVHIDARLPGTGHVTWIDASGPGEAPRYVTQWPPAEDEPPSARVAGREDADLLEDSELGDPSDQQLHDATAAAPSEAKPAKPVAPAPETKPAKAADGPAAETKAAPSRTSGPSPVVLPGF